MAGSLNKVMLIGNLGADPEKRETKTGGSVCSLRLATSERWTDKATGEKQERTEWHRVVVLDQKLADLCGQYLRKGAKIYCEGELQTRKWTDNAGTERYTTEVVLRPFSGRMTMLDRRQDSAPRPAAQSQDDDIPFGS